MRRIGKGSEGPLQKLLSAWRRGQRVAAEGLDPESQRSDSERLNDLLEIFDREDINEAVDQLERPN